MADEIQSKINRILSKHNDDLWIKLRLELHDLIEQLELLLIESPDNKEIVYDWLNLIKFLSVSCSGQFFKNDKQWSELLDLMQISRKFNHRSIKFREIVRNKHLIEANAAKIRRLNDGAQLSSTVEATLAKIDRNLQACQLEMEASDDDGTHMIEERSLLKELTRVRDYLQNSCLSLIHSIDLELANASVIADFNETLVKQWRTQLAGQQSLANEIAKFIEGLASLQTNLIQLKPLISTIKANSSSSNDNKPIGGSCYNKSDNLNNKFDICKREFRSVIEFHGELLKYLMASKSMSRDQADAARRQAKLHQPSAEKHTNSKQIAIPLARLFIKSTQLDKKQLSASNLILTSDLGAALERSINCLKQIDQITLSLRIEFGRFYFVNNIELLQIISLDSKLIQDCHLEQNRQLICKLFNNSIAGFILTQPNEQQQQLIVGVVSPLGERVEFFREKPIALRKLVNIYSVEIVRILNEVLRKLPRSLRNLLGAYLTVQTKGTADEGKNLVDIDWQMPLQLINLSLQVDFTRRVEKVLSLADDGGDGAKLFDKLIDYYENQFKQLISVKRTEVRKCEQNETIWELKKSAAVSMNVHFMSRLMDLKKHPQRREQQWCWFKFPRFYVEFGSSNEDDDTSSSFNVKLRIAQAQFDYKFDYLPVPGEQQQKGVTVVRGDERQNNMPMNQFKRLISTPSSEKCFLVASQAISRLRMGASPYGPAGSGKTETIKALGQLIGCQVIVHNCDETNDRLSLDRLVWGLAHTGLWGCFDEFNRLTLSTLSSVSATLELIQTSLRQNKQTIGLGCSLMSDNNNGRPGEGDEETDDEHQMISIDQDVAFFITMNPSDEFKYRGRRQLPANLRSLFLPISMCRFQIESIVFETLLSFAGESSMFARSTATAASPPAILDQLNAKKATELSGRLATWLDWMKANCSGASNLRPANKCEWDLRLVVGILRRFKMLLFLLVGGCRADGDENVVDLEQLVSMAIRNEMKPKLNEREASRLLERGLAQNFSKTGNPESFARTVTNLLLPDWERPLSGDDTLPRSVRDSLLTKVRQLNEQLLFKPGVILLGTTNCCKSLTWNRLASIKQEQVHTIALSPKCCRTQEELIGFRDPLNQKWVDGLLTKLVRQSLAMLNQPSNPFEQIWLILDGSIDPDWIECLNSVLDDNQVLTLASGERLGFQLANTSKCIKLIFETTSIEFASPATVSRLGLIYYDDEETNVFTDHPQLDSDQKYQTNENKQVLVNNAKLLGNDSEVGGEDLLTSERILSKFCSQNKVAAGRHVLILSGTHATSYSQSAAFRSSIVCDGKEAHLLEYNCNRFSHSGHLIEFVLASVSKSKSTLNVFVIRNVHLIRDEEANWKTKTLLELIRFIATYGFFYDTRPVSAAGGVDGRAALTSANLGWPEQRIQTDGCRFILTVDSLDSLDARLLSQANLLVVDRNEQQTAYDDNELRKEIIVTDEQDQVDAMLLGEIFSAHGGTLISTLVGLTESQLEESMAKITDGHCKLFKFNNTTQRSVSLECLTKLVASSSSGVTATSVEETTRERKTARNISLFILNQLEFELMDEFSQSQLFHLLNLLKQQASNQRHPTVKLVYLTSTSMSQDDRQVWASFGKTYSLDYTKRQAAIGNKEAIEQLLLHKLSDTKYSFHNSREFNPKNSNQIHLLTEKISDWISRPTRRNSDENPAILTESFTNCLLELLDKSWLELCSFRRTLLNGLDCLGRFESGVRQMRSRHEEESLKLDGLRETISTLIRQLNAQLAQSELKKQQIEQLRGEQLNKTKELNERSQLVEMELAQVRPLIEASKLELSEQLAKPEALNEIKSLRSPPKTIEQILKVLFIILLDQSDESRKQLSWPEMRQFLTKHSLRDELINFDFQGRLSARVLARVQQEIGQSGQAMSHEQASRASAAIVPILNWINATVEYGRVLTRLKPLNDELNRLQRESKQMQDELVALGEEQMSIEKSLADQTDELGRAEQQVSEIELKNEKIKRDLADSESIRDNLQQQFGRWRKQLTAVECLLDPDRLAKLCLLSVCLVHSNSNTGQSASTTFDAAIEAIFGPKQPRRELLAQLFQLIDIEQQQQAIADDDPEIMEKLVALLAIKLTFKFGHSLAVPVLSIATKQQSADPNEQSPLLVDFLSFEQILCQKPGDVQLIRKEQLGEQQQLDLLLGKVQQQRRRQDLVLFELTDTAGDLDLIDFIAADRQRSGPSSRCLLFQVKQREELENKFQHFGQTLNLISIDLASCCCLPSNTAPKQQQDTRLRDELVEMFMQMEVDSSVGKPDRQENYLERRNKIKLEIQEKQLELKSIDSRLLRQLQCNSGNSIISTSEHEQDMTNHEQNHELISILSESSRLNSLLERNLLEMRRSLRGMESKREDFLELGQICANFYQTFLSNLRGFNRFSRKHYAKLVFQLLANQQRARTTGNSVAPFVQLLACSMRPMEPNQRQTFKTSLSRAAADKSAAMESMFKLLSCVNPNDDNNNQEPVLPAPASGTTEADNSQQTTSIHLAATLAADLKQTILDLLTMQLTDGLVSGGGGGGGSSVVSPAGDEHNYKLMILLHNCKRSSPQLQLDELLGATQQLGDYLMGSIGKNVGFADFMIKYYKIYATTTTTTGARDNKRNLSSSSLERDLIRILADDKPVEPQQQQQQQRLGGSKSASQQRKCLKIVCIANAQLASSWLRAKLPTVIEETRRANQLLLVILVGEATTTTISGGHGEQQQVEVDSELRVLFDEAHLRCWHDESALSLIERSKLLLSNHREQMDELKALSTTTKTSVNKKITRHQIELILNGVILFHVVCQELSYSSARDGSSRWQSDSYNFDLNQLTLAFKLFKQIATHDDDGEQWTRGFADDAESIRSLFCNQLESIVYGSRMETEEDERLLGRLIAQFLGSMGSIEQRLGTFNQLIESNTGGSGAKPQSANGDELTYQKLLGELLRVVA